MHAGIEAVIYYPFFIIYTELIDQSDYNALNFGTAKVNIIALIAAFA